jgi:WD40 repeat protein
MIWHVASQTLVHTQAGHTGWLYSLAFHPDSIHLASGAGDNTVRIWDVVRGVETAVLSGHTNWVHGVAYSRDGKLLASGSGDETIRLWHGRTGKLLKVLRAKRPYEGLNIKGVTNLSDAQINTLKKLGAVG